MSRASLAKTVGGAGLAASLIALVAAWEGKSNDPYEDPLVKGLMTVCYGQTNVPMRRYSDAECEAMLATSLDKYAREVKRMSPSLKGNQLLAATSVAYNAGPAAYARSTARRRFDAGDLRGGCEALTWFNRAGGRVVQGLVNRRRAEYRLCVADL